MMSIAYDYTQDHSPVAAASKDRLLLIDGRRVPSASGRTFKSLNPATEQVIATIAEGNEIDVDRAVAAARRAFEGPWRTMRAAERGHILLKWGSSEKACERNRRTGKSRRRQTDRGGAAAGSAGGDRYPDLLCGLG